MSRILDNQRLPGDRWLLVVGALLMAAGVGAAVLLIGGWL